MHALHHLLLLLLLLLLLRYALVHLELRHRTSHHVVGRHLGLRDGRRGDASAVRRAGIRGLVGHCPTRKQVSTWIVRRVSPSSRSPGRVHSEAIDEAVNVGGAGHRKGCIDELGIDRDGLVFRRIQPCAITSNG